MLDDALKLLNNVFGYQTFRGLQEEIIAWALEGQDSLVLMPTGGGKSLCYQIPSMVRPGLGLVVSPLIALMQDQVSTLQQLGIEAAFLNSSLSPAEQSAVEARLHQGQIDILYLAPERLLQTNTLEMLKNLSISLIAVDEAHCVSQWGHDFRQDYLSLGVLEDAFPKVPRMALTATADARTRDDIVTRLKLTDGKTFVGGFDRPNIRYSVATKDQPKSQLLRFLSGHRDETGIVYCLSRRSVESTAKWLQTHDFDALPYHAGLPTETRSEHQERFLREDGVIMVATIAFGMGIDKPDVKFVAHMDLPKSVESYYQETGRAGRDGEPAEAWMVYGLQDVVRLKQMSESSEASEQHKSVERHKLDTLLGWCETTSCRRKSLLGYFGEERADDCGNCDVCLNPPKTWNATVPAQKLLSCIYRTEQRFGAVHVIDVLQGRATPKVEQHDHQRLSVFGIGHDLSDNQWRSVIRQLVVLGFLRVESERYGALVLTKESRSLLRGEITLYLREDIAEPKLRKKPKPKKRQVSDADQVLWDQLRACRKRLADEQGVPPYVIFHDATLMGMMEYRPSTPAQLLDINGVGKAKLESYGAEFLSIINGE